MAPVVLITGTSTGVGAACVTRLAAGGWTVLAGVRRVVDGEALVARVEGVRPLLMDVTDEVAIERAEEMVREVCGGSSTTPVFRSWGRLSSCRSSSGVNISKRTCSARWR
jgi:NAD(P)-dependent dehydrogenase (short-subunit alcohol dehydrogenase family)